MPEPASTLTLAEELVLLTLGGSRARIGRALRVAGLPDLRQVTHALEARGLLTRARPLHGPAPTPGPTLSALRRRMGAIIRGVDVPRGADAELLLLVACAGGLDAAAGPDHLNARHRIGDLGGRRGDPPAVLAKLCEEFRVDTSTELAGKLLPGRVRAAPGELDPGVNSAVWGGGHGGGTLG